MLRRQHTLNTSGRRVSPLLLLGVSVPLILILIALAVLVAPRLAATHAAGAADNMDCSLIVPPNPLSAQGLATPYRLVATNPANGACHEANKTQAAFVQGAVIDPKTGAISIYNPLVIDDGTQPAAQPVVPQLPAGGIVALWFGYNGGNLTLQDNNGSLGQGRCVNGINGSVFGQFAYCNAPIFFAVANFAMRNGQLVPPALGMANDGKVCPTVRDFSVVDMDQSDNVTTQYIIGANGQMAQLTAANSTALMNTNAAQMQTPQLQVNASDNRLLAVKVDGALGCHPWMAPDLADPGQMVAALPLNELQAAKFQAAPVAVVPANDPMVLVNGQPNLLKLNAYRLGVNQPLVFNLNNASTTTYCTNILNTAPARLQLDMPMTAKVSSPEAAVATNLFTFLGQRLAATFGNGGLNCAGLLNQPSPVAVTVDGNGVATAATITIPNANGNNNGGNGNGGNGNGNGTGGNGGGNGNGNGTGGNGNGNGGNGTGGANTPVTCTFNGTAIPNCAGTQMSNGQTCTIALTATNQVNITCAATGTQTTPTTQPTPITQNTPTTQTTPTTQATPSPQATQPGQQ